MAHGGRVMFVVGTRPEAIKMAPLIRAVGAHPDLEAVVVSTGQHREMLEQVFRIFDTACDLDLSVMKDRQTLSELSARVMTGVTDALKQYGPAAVVVQGDTTSAMVAALASFYERIPVVHLEAGLRSGDMANPFPEEANRRLISVLATLHLAPTRLAADRLHAEGVAAGDVAVTGNTVIDALLWAIEQNLPWDDPALEALDADTRRMVLVTAHRRESWGDGMVHIGRSIGRVATERPDTLFVLPMHMNPVVRESLVPELGHLDNVILTEPASYASFCLLLNRSYLVLTDSGGVQEEAPSLGKPVLVMREVTERTEGIDAGTAMLVPPRDTNIVDALLRMLDDPEAYERMAKAVNPYGDGRAAERGSAAIGELLGYGRRLADFA